MEEKNEEVGKGKLSLNFPSESKFTPAERVTVNISDLNCLTASTLVGIIKEIDEKLTALQNAIDTNHPSV